MAKPNLLFLMCDQLQGQVFEPGHPCQTPNLDAWIQQGVRITKGYTPNAVCSPARASLMTGLLPHNHGVLQVTHTVDDDQCCLREDRVHWAQLLEQAGYRTGYFGKWHVERSNQVEKFGWQVNGVAGGALYKQKRESVMQGAKEKLLLEKKVETPGYRPGLLYGVTNLAPEQRTVGICTALAMDFLDEAMDADNPWCCFVSVTEPHDPFVCGEEAYRLYDADRMELPVSLHDNFEGKPNLYKKCANAFTGLTEQDHKHATACYYGMVTEVDGQYGKLLDKLKASGQLDNTIVIFTSDHGELLGAHGLYTKNISAMEEVYHIPMMVSGPNIARGAAPNARVGLHDLYPTILELAGIPYEGVPDSASFASLLREPTSNVAGFQQGYAEYHGGRTLLTQRVVWDGNWKFVLNGFDYDELYNLEDDPHEMNNLIDDSKYTEQTKHLCSLLWNKIRLTNDHSLYNSHYISLRFATFGPLVEEQ